MHMVNPLKLKIPAILHAVLVNRLEILDLVCKKSLKAVNWVWQDTQGNNMLSYVLGALDNYSFVCSSVQQYCFEKIGQQTLKELLQMKNHEGIMLGIFLYMLVQIISMILTNSIRRNTPYANP